jgi:hypothetical protein
MYSLQSINGATREIKGKRYFEERVAGAKFKAIMIQASFRRWRQFDVSAVAMIIVTLWKVCGGNRELIWYAETKTEPGNVRLESHFCWVRLEQPSLII